MLGCQRLAGQALCRSVGVRWSSTAKPLVYCTRALPSSGLSKIRESGIVDLKVWEESIHPQPREQLFESVKNARGLVTLLSDKVDKELLDQAPNLEIISQFAVGYNNIDVEECSRRNIVVTNTPGVLTVCPPTMSRGDPWSKRKMLRSKSLVQGSML